MKNVYNLLHAIGMAKYYVRSIFLFAIILSITNLSAQQLAFPSAAGAGAYVSGGRGKTVYVVTNLNNSGTGSFRQALADAKLNDGGIITFAVSGTIELTSSLIITFTDNLTIAGQTAPAGGITIVTQGSNNTSAARFEIKDCNNLIMRYIRVRSAFTAYPATEIDPVYTYRVNNYIFDHCSASWGTDEIIDTGNGFNYTIQRCLFAESNKTGMIMGAQLEDSGDFSFLKNAFYNTTHRFPNFQSNHRVDIINNVIWNWMTRLGVPQGTFNVNHIGNYYEYFRSSPVAETYKRMMYLYSPSQGAAMPSIYTSGNYMSDIIEDPNADNWLLWRWRWNPSGSIYSGAGDSAQLPAALRSNTQFTQLGEPIAIQSYEDAYTDVTNDVGANARLDGVGNRIEEIDALDNIYLASLQSKTLVPYTREGNMSSSHRATFLASVSSIPTNTHPPNYYSSLDGIPNSWKQLKNLDLNTDYTTFEWPSGYVGIEEYLNEVDFPNTGETTGNQVIVTSNTATNAVCQGEEVILTASEADSYSWVTNGETSSSITVSPDITTTYTVTGTHSNGDITQAEITITVNETPTANAGPDVETCQGTAVTLTASGGTSYEWSNGETTASITVNPNTTQTFTVTVGNNDNCSSTDDVVVTVNQTPNVNAGEDQSIFLGESATLMATGADSYLWSTGETTQTITVNPLLDTSFSVTGTTSNCEQIDTVTVFLQDDSVSANAGEDIEICQGETTTLTAIGGTTYLWNTGETTASINVTPTEITTYTVTAFSPSGNNQAEDSVTVTVNEIPIANAGEDIEICFGNSTTLTASVGSAYLWSTGETTESITVSPSETTTYSVEIFENNCSSIDDVSVVVNPLPNVDAGNDISSIEGELITLTASGADTYLWNTGETTAIITVNPVLTTTYSVIGFLNGCEATDNVTVTILSETVAANAGEDIDICQGETVTLTATGGTTYLWNTGETTASIEVTPNATTTYVVTAFSPSGNNQDDDSVIVTVNNIPIANAGNNTEICLGNSTTLTATGGSAYLWSTGETTQSITVNPNQTTSFSVEVFENNCSSSDEVQVTVNALPATNAGADVTITEGESTTVTASGADTYIWSTGETTASITVNPNSTTSYSVTGFSNGCEAIDEVIVTVISEDNVNANAGTDVSICQGETTILTATGGETYLWNTGETTVSIEVAPNETTTYTVTAFSPSGNNQDDDSVIVTVNDIPVANAGNNTEICLGNSTTLTATGGSAYLWSTGETTQSITVNPNQTTSYSVEVFENNCSSSDEVQVTVNALPTINAGSDVTIMEGESTTLTATGADTYVWSTGETTASITVNPNSTTSYSVTGFSNGCEAIDEVIVTVISEDNVNANAGIDVSICQGETTTLTATGGETYLWNTGETTANIEVSPSQTTTYTVTAFSPSGNNQDDDSVIVTVNDIPVANAGNNTEICLGNSTTLTASGGSSYLWSTGETTQSITVNPNQTTSYSVEVFENNCSSLDEVLVTINALPTINAGSDVTIMEGESTTLTATGADTYVWSTGETTGSITVNPNNTTTYSVTGFSNQCEASDDVVVTVIPFEFIASAGANREICRGYQTTLTASEGDAYLWSTGETTQSITVNPSATQTYSVTVYQGEFQDDADVTVQVNENPNVVIMNGGDVTILEGEFITLSATGAETYLWNNGATQPNIAVSPTATTTYEVTGFINNCEDIKEVQVNVVELVQADAGEDVFICNNETVTLTASGGDEYLWNTGATTQSIEVSPNEDTEYSVLVYNALDGDEDSVRVFVEQCDIIELPTESEDFGFVVYQDPMSDILKIKINGLSTVNAKAISVYDITGKAIYNEQLNPADLENQSELIKEINTSLYARGIYMVKLVYDDTNAMKKVPIR